MKITNAKFSTSEQNLINAVIDGKNYSFPVGDNPYYNFLIQNNIQIASFEFPDVTLTQVRIKRNALLAEMDKYALAFGSAPLPQGVTPEDIVSYKQALRDFPNSVNLVGVKDINDVRFPNKPF
jgi:hypothetical protein